MSSKPTLHKFLALIIIIVTILGGCSLNAGPALPTAAPTEAATTAPTLAPTENVAATLDQVRTQAAQTVVANLTLNAPTVTPVPPTSTVTVTPTITQTATATKRPTATYIPWTLTPSLSPTPLGYACEVTSASPKSTDSFKINTDFDGNWVVKNTGTQTWVKAETDIKYISGTKMQTKADLFDLPVDVASKASYSVVVDMRTPATAGTYTASWAIVQGGLTICTLNLSVKVTN